MFFIDYRDKLSYQRIKFASCVLKLQLDNVLKIILIGFFLTILGRRKWVWRTYYEFVHYKGKPD
jgi:hypothetical protein